jgi:hypothetical protein
VVAALPNLGHDVNVAASHRTGSVKASPDRTPADLAASRKAATRPIAAFGSPGRFAIYDPDLLDAHNLPLLDPPDLNVHSAMPSLQGYSSLVDSYYAAATGSHQATGDGQDVLAPRAIGDGVLDQLDASILLTVPAYLTTRAAGTGVPAQPRVAGHRDVAARTRAAWYLAATLDVSELRVPDSNARQDAAAGTQIGIMTPGALTRWLPASTATPTVLAAKPPQPVRSVAVIARAGRESVRLGPPSITGRGGSSFTANGQLQDALEPPRWAYAGHDGPFAIFDDKFARGPLTLRALRDRSASGASILRVTGGFTSPTTATVRSPRGIRVIRSVAATPGWTATWRAPGSPAMTLRVRRAGLVQAIDVPAGQGVITWSYRPPWFTPGLALSLGSAALILLLASWGLAKRRSSDAADAQT